MERKDGRIHWVLKRMMMVTGAVLTILLGIQGMRGVGREIGWKNIETIALEWAESGMSFLWKQNYPAAVWKEETKEGIAGAQKGGIKGETRQQAVSAFLCRILFGRSPVYRYLSEKNQGDNSYEEPDPAYWEYVTNGRFYEEHQFLLYDGGEESGEDGTRNPGTSLADSRHGESGAVSYPAGMDGQTKGGGDGEAAQARGEIKGDQTQEGQTSPGNPPYSDTETCASSAVWPVIGQTYRLAQLADYDFMMKHFYSVHTSTTAGRDLMNAEQFLSKDFALNDSGGQPQILIYHTHSQEEFADYTEDHPERTVVGMGNYLTELLTQKGYQVIHDTSVYDFRDGKLDRNKAYTYALEGVSRILQENPSIEVILDLHRDGVNAKLHMVNEVNGKPTAPIMFFNGISQTPEGPIEYLPNPYREDNLAFSFQMQLDAAAYFPGLTRKIYIKGLRYNLHLRPRSSLIEVGAQTNTYEEARNAMEPLAEVLDMVLQGN